MNKLQVFLLLRHNQKLSERRSLMYNSNRKAKIIFMILSLGVVFYMLFLSVAFSLVANSINSFTSSQFFFSLLPLFILVDFVVRFLFHSASAQIVKPYLLLPMRRRDCVDCFIFTSALSCGNLLWLFMTVPFVLMSVVFKCGVVVSFNLIFVFQLLVVANSLFYMLCRVLFSYRYYFALLPVFVFTLILVPFAWKGIDGGLYTYSQIGTMVVDNPFVLYFFVFILLVGLFGLNRVILLNRIQYETSSFGNVRVSEASSLSIFNKLGTIGEYLKIEVKSLSRNRSIRNTFVFQMIFVVILSVVNSFTDLYGDAFSTRFWAVYPFILFCINLVRIMRVEGNYIECLMVRKEKIRDLLEEKYWFYSILQLFPLVLMLPTVIFGKYSFLMLVSLMSFTIGPLYFLLMQLAVSNKQSLPLNSRLMKKSGCETNYLEILFQMLTMFIPVLLLFVLPVLFGETFSYIILLVIGLSFVFTHKYWIGGIYNRMMKKKYQNIYGFMTSR